MVLETQEEVDEISWQNYKGLLTEKQEKTRDKVIKRLEKVSVFFAFGIFDTHFFACFLDLFIASNFSSS